MQKYTVKSVPSSRSGDWEKVAAYHRSLVYKMYYNTSLAILTV